MESQTGNLRMLIQTIAMKSRKQIAIDMVPHLRELMIEKAKEGSYKFKIEANEMSIGSGIRAMFSQERAHNASDEITRYFFDNEGILVKIQKKGSVISVDASRDFRENVPVPNTEYVPPVKAGVVPVVTPKARENVAPKMVCISPVPKKAEEAPHNCLDNTIKGHMEGLREGIKGVFMDTTKDLDDVPSIANGKMIYKQSTIVPMIYKQSTPAPVRASSSIAEREEEEEEEDN